jgi:hypothetical protein
MEVTEVVKWMASFILDPWIKLGDAVDEDTLVQKLSAITSNVRNGKATKSNRNPSRHPV